MEVAGETKKPASSPRRLARNSLGSSDDWFYESSWSASLVIYLIVQHEFSFDKFEKDGDRIYWVVSKTKYADMAMNNHGVPAPTAKAVKDELTGLARVPHFLTMNNSKVGVWASGSGTH